MLKQRIITGIILVLIVLGAIFLLPPWAFTIAILLVTLLAGREWIRLTGPYNSDPQIVYLTLIAVTFVVGWLFLDAGGGFALFMASAVWWLIVLVILAVYQPETFKGRWLRPGLQLAGVLTLIPAGLALIEIQSRQAGLLVYVFMVVWVADSAAYFTGRALGRNKLAPLISPGKTREGVLGGLVATIPLALAGAWLLELNRSVWVYFIMLSLLIAMASVVGDLFESLVKRIANVKDSGTLLPGHGGILDRIDSVTAAAPLFVTGLYWMN